MDTSSSTYFPLFQIALHPASTPDSNQRRSSISPPRNNVAFSLAKQVSFEHSISSPITSRREENHLNKRQTNDQQKVSPQFVVDRSSARQLAQISIAASAAASTGTVLLPNQMSQIAGHVYNIMGNRHQALSVE